MLMSREFKVVVRLMCLRGVAWLTCMPYVGGAWRMLRECSTSCRHMMSFGMPYILGGCAMHGHGNKALKYFEQMCGKGVQPNDITFVCLLSACSHCRFGR